MSVKYGKPTELPIQYVPPKSWELRPQDVPERKEKRGPPLKEAGDDQEETGDEEENDDYKEDYPGEEDESRKRRDLSDTQREEDSVDREFCTMSSCMKILCKIGRLPKGEEVSVIFPAIAWARTIRKVSESILTSENLEVRERNILSSSYR